MPLLEGEYIVKFADDGGRFSPDDTSVIVDLPDALGKLLVKNHREDQQTPLPFQGTHVDTFYSDQYDALTLDGSTLIDSVADVDLIPIIDFLGDIKSLGTYTLLDTIDMGLALDAVEFSRRFVTRGFCHLTPLMAELLLLTLGQMSMEQRSTTSTLSCISAQPTMIQAVRRLTEHGHRLTAERSRDVASSSRPS